MGLLHLRFDLVEWQRRYRMKLLLAGLMALTFGSTMLHAEPAQCIYCVPTFCGNSAECAPGCACIDFNDGSGGHCFGAR